MASHHTDFCTEMRMSQSLMMRWKHNTLSTLTNINNKTSTAGDYFVIAQASDVFNNMDSDHSGIP